MTLSVLAVDQDAQLVGAAVTSCALAAGRRILHVRAGVGAAVTQASSDIAWGDEILDRMASGADPADAIAPYRRGDSQVAAIDFAGQMDVHTGPACEPHAGQHRAPGVCAQANLAAAEDAWIRMTDAYEHAAGPMAERLIAALAASGGDSRGAQGAGVIVTAVGPLRGYAHEPHVDLRVDDHRDPVGELARLLDLHRAHCIMRQLTDDVAVNDRASTLRTLLDRHPGDPHLRRALRRLE